MLPWAWFPCRLLFRLAIPRPVPKNRTPGDAVPAPEGAGRSVPERTDPVPPEGMARRLPASSAFRRSRIHPGAGLPLFAIRGWRFTAGSQPPFPALRRGPFRAASRSHPSPVPSLRRAPASGTAVLGSATPKSPGRVGPFHMSFFPHPEDDSRRDRSPFGDPPRRSGAGSPHPDFPAGSRSSRPSCPDTVFASREQAPVPAAPKCTRHSLVPAASVLRPSTEMLVVGMEARLIRDWCTEVLQSFPSRRLFVVGTEAPSHSESSHGLGHRSATAGLGPGPVGGERCRSTDRSSRCRSIAGTGANSPPR